METQLLLPAANDAPQYVNCLPNSAYKKPPAGFLMLLDDSWRVMKLLAHPRRHFHLHQILFHQSTRQLYRRHPKLAYKYLVDYASKALSTEQRGMLLAQHYGFLQKRLVPSFINAISHDQICLWQLSSQSPRITIDLSFPAKLHTEGDLCLTLRMDGVEVYRLIFVIGNGASLGVDASHALLITCIQGLRALPELRLATALCEDVHPSHVLMEALAGFAQAVGVPTLVGIKTCDQIANTGRIFFSYDEFFEKYGGACGNVGAYVMNLPFEQKSISLVPAKHRNRTRARRAFRQAVKESAAAALARFVS